MKKGDDFLVGWALGLGLATVLVLVFFLATEAQASDKYGVYTVYGVGANDCQELVAEDDALKYKHWIGGYVTAINRASHLRTSIGTANAIDVYQAVHAICVELPDRTVEDVTANVLRYALEIQQ